MKVGKIECGLASNDPNWTMDAQIKRLRPSDGLCANCRTRPATLDWVGEGGSLAVVHGMVSRWCEVCATEAQLAYAKKLAAMIPELESKLAHLRTAK